MMNSEFLFIFEAIMTNPNGDPDQENKPRMDEVTRTNLVSDVRLKRNVRNFLKYKNFPIYVDTINDKKVSMETMFEHIRDQWMTDEKFKQLLNENEELKKAWKGMGGGEDDFIKYYNTCVKEINKKKGDSKRRLAYFNDLFMETIIKKSLIDIRLFGSAMAIENVTKEYTGPIQINWGYSLHPVEHVKSNSITTIMNDDHSTFGEKNKLYYALIAHHGTVSKINAQKTGMTEKDLEIFRKALVQGMLSNVSDSKQGQIPLLYLEVVYKENNDVFIGDFRRFIDVRYDENKPIRKFSDLEVDFKEFSNVIKGLYNYIEKVILWINPVYNIEQFKNLSQIGTFEEADLFETLDKNAEG